MNLSLTKNHKKILAVVAIAAVAYYFYNRPKKDGSGFITK